MSWLLNELNPEQRTAVETTEGPLLIIAGAGSGKTRVLTRRLAYLLSQRLAEPHEILAVTFTNKAAGEMKERVAELLGGGIPSLSLSTFHSFCNRLLRREATAIGYERDFTIFDSQDSQSLIKSIIKSLKISEEQFPAKGQHGKISDLKNQLISAEDFRVRAAGYFESRTSEIYTHYQQRLRQCQAMDFDDLLTNAVWLLRDNPRIADGYRERFRYLMVDEYQDTNHVQYMLLKLLLGAHNNIAVVGDEDQSIYGWRGADIRNILEFEKDFPGAQIIKLEQNYRSTGSILKAASAVISHNIMRKNKKLWTDAGNGDPVRLLLVDNAEGEAAAITDLLNAGRTDGSLKESVILYRTNAQSRPFEEQLRRRNIPYQIIGGLSFYQRKEIKDLLAYLKLMINADDDVAFERIVNYPKRGIGDKTVEDIRTLARAEQTSSYKIALQAVIRPELAAKFKRLEGFTTLIEKHKAAFLPSDPAATQPLDVLLEELITDLRFIEELRSEDEVQGQTRVENVEAFIEGAAEYAREHAEGSLAEYLAEISLFTDLDSYREIEDKVTLMTIHGAKGLEYNTVFLVGLEEGLFPMQRAIIDPRELEEERRLFYVGATRARKLLTLSAASARHRFGEVESLPSRFIREIPADLLEKRDQRTSRLFSAGTGYNAAPASVTRTTYAAASRAKEGVHYEYDHEESMAVGRIVAHPTFGRGKIIRTEGYGESLRLEIMFSAVGVKKIMARFAKLKLVG